MITGTHILFYSENPEADRLFFRQVLGFKSVDAGHGWLIFALPPAEAGIHPVEGAARNAEGNPAMMGAELHLMCDDLKAEIQRLQAHEVKCSPVDAAPWGAKTTFRLPSGRALGLYQPRHPTAIDIKAKPPVKARSSARSR